MFAQKDFQDPQRSALFHELEGLSDQRIKMLVQELKRACTLSTGQVRFPFHLLDPDHDKKQALELLKQAIATDDDERIAKLWTPELAKYQGAQSQHRRAQLAQQRISALTQWRAVLKNGNLARIVVNYRSVLDQCKSMTQAERTLLVQARKFLQAFNDNDDDALLTAVDTLMRLSGSLGITFTPQEERRITQIRQCKKDIQQIKTALQSNSIATIAATYASFQRIQHYLTKQECQMVELAYNFLQAYNKDDDNALLVAFDAIQQSAYRAQLQPSQQEEQRVTLARRKKGALTRFRTVLNNKNLVDIITASNYVLDSVKKSQLKSASV